jgi:hypothetical protein
MGLKLILSEARATFRLPSSGGAVLPSSLKDNPRYLFLIGRMFSRAAPLAVAQPAQHPSKTGQNSADESLAHVGNQNMLPFCGKRPSFASPPSLRPCALLQALKHSRVGILHVLLGAIGGKRWLHNRRDIGKVVAAFSLRLGGRSEGGW